VEVEVYSKYNQIFVTSCVYIYYIHTYEPYIPIYSHIYKSWNNSWYQTTFFLCCQSYWIMSHKHFFFNLFASSLNEDEIFIKYIFITFARYDPSCHCQKTTRCHQDNMLLLEMGKTLLRARYPVLNFSSVYDCSACCSRAPESTSLQVHIRDVHLRVLFTRPLGRSYTGSAGQQGQAEDSKDRVISPMRWWNYAAPILQ
jgi:hypothetical protein